MIHAMHDSATPCSKSQNKTILQKLQPDVGTAPFAHNLSSTNLARLHKS